ncbi:hypothetical protein Hanom_Chr04g00300871 [Helianthus anomalus]
MKLKNTNLYLRSIHSTRTARSHMFFLQICFNLLKQSFICASSACDIYTLSYFNLINRADR